MNTGFQIMKDLQKRGRVGCIVSIILVLLLFGVTVFACHSGASFTQMPDEALDYSNIIRQNVGFDARVVDIAMLGAHDAFADKISPRSEPCPNDTGFLSYPGIMTLMPGYISRFARTQKSDAAGLLRRGVRYFDVRITFHNNTWYTQHGLINEPLKNSLVQTIEFLTANPGELIIFDIQHARLGSSNWQTLWAHIASVEYGGRSLFDFVTFDPYNTPLEGLTYGAATQNGTVSAAVITARDPQSPQLFHYYYNDSVRSVWHNKIRTSELIEGVEAEAQALRNNPELDRGKIRVNQAQLTANLSSPGEIFTTLASWSLLTAHARHNVLLLEHKNFTAWLEVLPIFMTDFSDSPTGNFNSRIIEKINGFNRRGLPQQRST